VDQPTPWVCGNCRSINGDRADRCYSCRAPRALAVDLFNRAWDLLEGPRSPADDRVMLASALASRLHWTGIGNDENYAAGDWLVAHVASHLGYCDVALDFAASAYETAQAAEPPVPSWLLASTQEGLARAHACAGDTSDAVAHRGEMGPRVVSVCVMLVASHLCSGRNPRMGPGSR